MAHPIGHRVHAVLFVTTCLATGCLAAPDAVNPAPDAGEAAAIVSAQDHAGIEVPLQALPRWVALHVELGREPELRDGAIAIFEGDLDDELAADLARAPLSAGSRARLVPSEVQLHDTTRVVLEPRTPLAPGARYTLAIAGFARYRDGTRVTPDGSVFARALLVDASPHAGAKVVAALPSAASAGVPTNLASCALAFDGDVHGEQAGLWLEGPDGLAVPAQVSRFDCAELASQGSTCVQLVPEGELAPLARYTLRTGARLRDSHGAPVLPWSASFVTAEGADRSAPRFAPLTCAIDERLVDAGCAVVSDTSIALRGRVDEAVRFVVRDARGSEAQLAPRGELAWTRTGLEPGTTSSFDVEAIDAAGNVASTRVALTTAHDLPALSITEVRADPRGREPLQEYVEIASHAATPIDLAGFSLADSVSDPGSPITQHVFIYPGTRALLVADGFDPAAPEDVPPPPGTPLVHLGKALGHAGLANAGEPLFLRDPHGRRVSAAPAQPPPKPGVCLVRTSSDPRSGDADGFGYDAGASCTPGR